MQPVDESDEEENSFDKNDAMSEEDVFVDGLIEIPADGHIEISDDGGDAVRGKKQKKGNEGWSEGYRSIEQQG